MAHKSSTVRTKADLHADTEAQILRKVQMVLNDESTFGVLSSGEKIAVAFVLDRPDLVKKAWGTLLSSIDRLGPEWTRGALQVQRNLDCPPHP